MATTNGRAWLIVLVSFFADALSLGGRALFSVALLVWEDEFGWTRDFMSSLMSIVHFAMMIATPLSGHVADLIPPKLAVTGGLVYLGLGFFLTAAVSNMWQATVFYGIILGSAYGALNLNVFSAAIIRAMPSQRSAFAVSIATTGGTFGQFIFVPLFLLSIPTLGWRFGFAVLGFVSVILAVPSVFLIGSPKASSSRGDQVVVPVKVKVQTQSLWQKLCTLFGNGHYWALTVAFVICGITTTGLMETHIVGIAVSKGFSRLDGASSFSVLSIFNGLGMLMAGYISDRYNRAVLLSAIFFVRAMAYAILLYSQSLVSMYIFAAVFGIADYAVVPPVISLVEMHAGASCVGLGVGILLAWHSGGGALGSLLGGWFFISNGHYDGAMILSAALCIFASLVCACMVYAEPWRRRRSPRSKGDDVIREIII